jgi:hypothetical protein
MTLKETESDKRRTRRGRVVEYMLYIAVPPFKPIALLHESRFWKAPLLTGAPGKLEGTPCHPVIQEINTTPPMGGTVRDSPAWRKASLMDLIPGRPRHKSGPDEHERYNACNAKSGACEVPFSVSV